MEIENTTSITCSTKDLSEVAWFLKMNFRNYAHALITACEPNTGKKFNFNFHFINDYATFVGVGEERSPIFVDFDGLKSDSVGEALDRMVTSINEQS